MPIEPAVSAASIARTLCRPCRPQVRCLDLNTGGRFATRSARQQSRSSRDLADVFSASSLEHTGRRRSATLGALRHARAPVSHPR
jgi:hypothetical protein